MSKRDTDTEKWKDPWFRKLPPHLKCLWLYICDEADVIGLWKGDFEVASMLIGTAVTEPDLALLNAGKERLRKIGPDSWLITGFTEFHYGDKINSSSHPFHRNIRKRLADMGKRLDSPSDNRPAHPDDPTDPLSDSFPDNLYSQSHTLSDRVSILSQKQEGKETGKEKETEQPDPALPAQPASPRQQVEQLYNAFPKHAARGEAVAAIEAALGKAPFDVLLAGVRRYAAECRGREARFIASPAAWFRQERWTDETPPPAAVQPRNGRAIRSHDLQEAEIAADRRRVQERRAEPRLPDAGPADIASAIEEMKRMMPESIRMAMEQKS